MHYCARLYPDDGAVSVEFADCPGCLTFGESRDEALANAKEALEGWLETHLDVNRVPPKPTTVEGEPIEVPEELAARLEAVWGPRKTYRHWQDIKRSSSDPERAERVRERTEEILREVGLKPEVE